VPRPKKPAVSVVVPVYNSNDTLAETIKSIEAQTFTDYELIIIDDRSTDDTPATIKLLAAKNPKITPVTNPKNLGIGAVRNLAVELASGKYIAFIDADDIVHPKYLEKLHLLATDNDADIAICGYNEVYKRRVNPKHLKTSAKTVIFTPQEAISNFLRYGELSTFVWGRIIAKKLFAQIKFPEDVIFEDVATIYKLYAAADKIAYTPARLYDYIQRTNSSVHTHRNLRDITFFLSVPDQVAEYLGSSASADDILYFKFRVQLAALNQMLTSKPLHIPTATRIAKFTRSNYALLTKLPLSHKERLQLSFIRLGVAPYQFLHSFQRTFLRKNTR